MVKSILGSKVGMTQIFDSQGHVVPVTVVQAGPCIVTQVKTRDTDGYDAVQIGFGETHAHRLTRAKRGHLGLLPAGKTKSGDTKAGDTKAGDTKAGDTKAGDTKAGEAKTGETSTEDEGARSTRPLPAYRHLREIRLDAAGDLVKGSEIRVDSFAEGDMVAVTGVTKGKGYAGAIKRHHFHGASMTHGVMEVHRKPASSGATDAARTFKGVKKPGHLGNDRVTTRGLTVVRVDPEKNLLLIKGAVPGATGGLLFVRALKGA